MNTDRSATFGTLLRRTRLAAGLTQADLAERTGLSARAISDLERGRHRAPSRRTFASLSTALVLSESDTAALAGTAAQRRPTRRGRTVAGNAPTPRSAPLTNIPPALTSFVGRDQQRAELHRLLVEHRLVTLTGAGGCGKTRLALEVAADLGAGTRSAAEVAGTDSVDVADGVWLVELGALMEVRLVPRTVAAAFGLPDVGSSPIDGLVAHLKSRRLLLVLDNCEHLLDACASLVERLLSSAPGLRVLATSRELLNCSGEVVWSVPPLSVPPVGAGAPTQLLECEAVRLFAERAAAVRSSFAVAQHNADVVAQICRRLDGLPLAIELAAARIRHLGVHEIAARLDDRFNLLVGGSRTVLLRHQALRTAIAWSYDLLAESEQELFDRLSVFPGSFGVDAVEALAGALPAAVLGLLGSLVDKSLVVMQDVAGGVRYRLLETLREYGRERLDVRGEREPTFRRLVEYALLLAADAQDKLVGTSVQAQWLARFEDEHDTLRAALAYLRDHGEVEALSRLAALLWPFWRIRGHFGEAHGWFEDGLAVGGTSAAARVELLNAAGHLAVMRDENRRAMQLCEEALALGRDLDDRRGSALALRLLGIAAHQQGDYERALALLGEGLRMERAIGDPRRLATTLGALANLATYQGDHERAAQLYVECIEQFRAAKDIPSLGGALNNLAILHFNRGDLRTAARLYEQGLELFRRAGDKRGILAALNNLGKVVQEQGDLAWARVLHEESLGLARELGQQGSIADSFANLGEVACDAGEYTEAAEQLSESLRMRREIGAQRGIANSLSGLGRVALLQGELDRADVMYEESLALRRGLGDARHVAEALRGLARVSEARGDVGRARALFDESLSLQRDAADARGPVASIEGFARLDAREGDAERAVRLLAAAAAERGRLGLALPTADRGTYEQLESHLRARLGDSAFATNHEAGRALTLAQAIDVACAPMDSSRPQERSARRHIAHDGLTPRELELLRLVARGSSNRDIAEELVISLNTVGRHLVNVYTKIGARGRADATAYAFRHGLA